MSLPKQVEAQVEDFIDRLKRRQIVGSFFVAKETATILRQVVSMSRWRDANTLIDIVTETGVRLASAQPNELAVGNIVKRVLKVIREVSRGELKTDDRALTTPEDSSYDEEGDDEEYEEEEEEEVIEEQKQPKDTVGKKRPTLTTQTSMFRLLADMSNMTVREKKREENERRIKDTYHLKPLIIQEITEEIIADLDTIYKGIADQALDFIHANEVIMTTGQSRTVQEFLIRAAQKRKFQVIVAETAPTYQGHKMALALSKAGIDTTVVADSAIFAAMPRVNKVVLGAHAVLANGALISVSGSHLLAAAAKHHSTPVLVCTALYKLSPLFAYDADAFNVTVTPQNVLSFQEGAIIDKVTITNPYYDYVGPDYVSLFIHNLGSAPPTYVYRLINDNYDPEDSTLM
ncbi:nagb/rpia/CoA transferase-like protein [Rhizopus microsporus ATCC 52813]|uniref:Translation initiation factor eIF2B subunit beta n=2 Tax=Rhizopus microsporus TaxID=58291 RepID=A0A2G4T3F3_RHIZD|nr:nagb/rpia/CoA transferase-like protein [Rhizopus microsporus ATCC 52813]PHZ15538.1 nagb/rpia/CoA transferase-like protein [Rhizopus microsporus ATCC 52813]